MDGRASPAPAPGATRTTLGPALLVLPERVVRGRLRLDAGRIAAVEVLDDAPRIADGRGSEGADYILPGLVDLHTDHIEKHLHPRVTAPWDPLSAALAYDAQVIAAGVTTVFDSLSVGAAIRQPERRDLLFPALDALARAAELGMMRAEHRLHLRCEISDPDTPALLERVLGRPGLGAGLGLVSLMDHAPGDRQSPDMARWTRRMAENIDVSLDEMIARRDALLDRSARLGPAIRAHCARAALSRGLALMSHDDAREEHVALARAEGAAISEFPTSLEAARAAKAAGMAVIAGGPNLVRGQSMTGNVAARDLAAAGLLDILASDYVPRSLLDAAFVMADDPTLPQGLSEAVAMVSAAPARAAGLHDRGALTPGMRADVIRVRRAGGVAHVAEAWREGRRVL
ncbi:MAG: alpha-D-ribose 1-methylphosphonate 5-triphosphate diphosphatase [Pseudomonadota bacterium]|nr:alpha-D-ribose 1-methylphosphonate 5-triphosphate diphosphatase [Pseudomonadota bacterium]